MLRSATHIWRARFRSGPRDGQTDLLAHRANAVEAPGGAYFLTTAIPIGSNFTAATYVWHPTPTPVPAQELPTP